MKKLLFLLISFALFLMNCGGDNSKTDERKKQAQDYAESMKIEEEIGAQARSMFQPLAAVAENPNNPITESKVKLGKILYYDNRLSKDQTQSCNTCHDLSTFGVDNDKFSEGDDGGLGDRNSPTVYNAAFHTSQFWDGRAKDVEEQAGMPILNPVEMAIPSEEFLVKRLSGTELYPPLFAAAFPDDSNPVTFENIEFAIAAFERTLVTPSKFDDYLKGNKGALNLEEKKGLQTFIAVGCLTCHTGSQLGGNMLQKFGVYENYWTYTKSDPIDEGRFKETANEADKYMFKVPTLRNVVKTYPYFHDGNKDP
jgi:cytochrome c peroxidase